MKVFIFKARMMLIRPDELLELIREESPRDTLIYLATRQGYVYVFEKP